MDDWLFKGKDGFPVDEVPTESSLPSGGRVQWIVVEKNVTEDSVLVGPQYSFPVILTFGSVLTIAAILSSLTIIGLLIRQGSSRRQKVAWLFLHFSLVQVATVLLLIPTQIDTVYSGHWRGGSLACRTWLLGRVLLSSLSTWSALALTIDRLFHTVRPKMYEIYINGTRVALLVLMSWLAALVTALPVATSMWYRRYEGDELIYDNLCIINLSKQLTIGLSAAQFFVPGMILVFCTIIAAIDAAQTRLARRLRCYIYDTVNSASTITSDDITKTQSTDIRCATAIILANISLFLWCIPYYSIGLAAVFCKNTSACVSPNVWQATQWLSYVNCTITPLVWLIDADLRLGTERSSIQLSSMSPKRDLLNNKDGTKYSRIINKRGVDHPRNTE